MKTIKTIFLTGNLIGAAVIMAAFNYMRNEKELKTLQEPSTGKGFAVVELFTSEGCSSCPPADELVKRIQQDNQNKQIYILSFHVDYWDHQGWRDRFSDHVYSERQRRYADWLNVRTVYTPQIVVNGASEHIGSDQGPVIRAISAGLQQETEQTLELNAKTEGRKVTVTFSGAGKDPQSELVLALVQRAAESRVKAGENSGRDLAHVQIVRDMAQVELNREKPVTLELPKDFGQNGWEVIGFVQRKTDGHITNAGRYDLQKAK